MQKVKIIATTHPRLNVGFVYTREEATGGVRYTSLGGKHSVFIQEFSDYVHVFEPVHGYSVPKAPTFHTEPHVRIGERIAADLWRETHTSGETIEVCDDVTKAFLKRWQEGFFRGEAVA